jgi:hypothetical protein
MMLWLEEAISVEAWIIFGIFISAIGAIYICIWLENKN